MSEAVTRKLFELQDIKYRDFNKKLIPTVDENTVIGVRTPLVRKIAAEIAGTDDGNAFMKKLPHRFYEENNLHGFMIEKIKDYSACIDALNNFLPYVDNWATCDGMTPKALKKDLPALIKQIRLWVKADHVYTVRFAIGMLMKFFLDEEFSPEYLEIAADVRSEEYYINMMLAWYFATALAKQYDAAIPYIENKKLSVWVHNKTIQKAVESYRITDAQKKYLKTLKIK